MMSYNKKLWILVLCLPLLLEAASEIPTHANRQQDLTQDPSSNTVSLIDDDSRVSNHSHARLLKGRGRNNNAAYSRPRYLRLQDKYTHVDVSDQFSSSGKKYVSLLFIVVWAVSMIPNCRKHKAGISLAGAVLMLFLRSILKLKGHAPRFDFWERLIFWKPLIVQFGLMVSTIGIERDEYDGLVQRVGRMLDDPVPWKRCRRIIFLATVGSAAVSRDIAVYLFSGVVTDLCVRHNVADPMPYLLSLSTAANIGSAMTLTGTPSNLLVSTLNYDPISWQEFANNLLLPMLSASIINFILIMLFHRSELFYGSASASNSEQVYEMIGVKETDEECNEEGQEDYVVSGEVSDTWSIWSILQLVGIGASIFCFAAGLDIQKVSIGLGVCMMVLALFNRRYYQGGTANSQGDDDVSGGDQVSTRVQQFDYSILIVQLGQFLMVGSLNDTGVPQAAFMLMMGDRCVEVATRGLCLYRYVMVIAAASTIFSSLGVVQMSAATFPYWSPYNWVQTSFAANIAGNLAIMRGTSAHRTAGDQFSRTTGKSSPMTLRSYTLFGLVSGLLSLVVGTYLLSNFHSIAECSERLGECEYGY